MSDIAATPKPPYYAVVFTSLRTENIEGDDGYEAASDEMLALAAKQSGFLGVESAREELGITVSYWRDLASIRAWKSNVSHQLVQKKGREEWYSDYKIRVSKVEYDYGLS